MISYIAGPSNTFRCRLAISVHGVDCRSLKSLRVLLWVVLRFLVSISQSTDSWLYVFYGNTNFGELYILLARFLGFEIWAAVPCVESVPDLRLHSTNV